MAHPRQVNISPIERVGRVLLGLHAMIIGVVLLARSPTTGTLALDALLVAAGLPLVVTGAIGQSPLYTKLGHVPRSLRKA